MTLGEIENTCKNINDLYNKGFKPLFNINKVYLRKFVYIGTNIFYVTEGVSSIQMHDTTLYNACLDASERLGIYGNNFSEISNFIDNYSMKYQVQEWDKDLARIALGIKNEQNK